MLELRRGRSQNRDDPLMGSLHEMEIDVLGITGITVDRSQLRRQSNGNFNRNSNNNNNSKQSNGLAPPEKMKAVVAVFSEGHFCASSGLSHHLKKTQPEPTNNHNNNARNSANSLSNNSKPQECLMALWGKRSRTSKIKFVIQMDHSISSADPAIFEIWIALTDGKGENKTCISFPIGLGTLPVDGEQTKPIHLDLPLSGILPNQEESGSSMGGEGGGPTGGFPGDDLSSSTMTAEEKKMEENNYATKKKKNTANESASSQPTVGSVYGLKSHGGAMLRLKVECKPKKFKKENRRRTVRLSNLHEGPHHDQYQQHRSDTNADPYCFEDEEGSKMFRPIETSSLVSETAYSLGDVVSSRLPAKTLDQTRADLIVNRNNNHSSSSNSNKIIGNIDESQEMDFSEFGSSVDRSGKILEKGPKSAFTAISPGKTAPLTCSTGTVGRSYKTAASGSGDEMGRLLDPSSPDINEEGGTSKGDLRRSPMDLGTLDPMQEEPSELGESFKKYHNRKQQLHEPIPIKASNGGINNVNGFLDGKNMNRLENEFGQFSIDLEEDDLDLPNLLPGQPSVFEDGENIQQERLPHPREPPIAPTAPGGHVPLVIRTVSQIRGKPKSSSAPKSKNKKGGSGAPQVTTVDDDSLNRSIVSTAVRNKNHDSAGPSCLPYCGIFGPILQIPLSALVKDGDEDLVLRDFEDDHTWSTIETRNSSQIVAWHDSVRAYAAETSSVGGLGVTGGGKADNNAFSSLFFMANNCTRGAQAILARNVPEVGADSCNSKSNNDKNGANDQQSKDIVGWWNDGANVCM